VDIKDAGGDGSEFDICGSRDSGKEETGMNEKGREPPRLAIA